MMPLLSWPAWLKRYQPSWLTGDLTAGLIVTVMLIPQSLAYAMLAGLPPQVGIYASILPLLAYAFFGTSMTLAVGPVAVASLMTASALQPLAAAGSVEYVVLAAGLALLSGLMLFLFGVLRLGFLAYFLSHPVISGFITGSAILIAIGQLKYIFGVKVAGSGVVAMIKGLARAWSQLNPSTTAIGLSALVFLFFSRKHLSPILSQLGLPVKLAELMSKLAPMLVVIVSTFGVGHWGLNGAAGVSVVGDIPAGLPQLIWPAMGTHELSILFLPALLIALVGFVESVSVAQSLALKRQQRIQPNQELLGLGAANIASALSGGYPVTGGFARSVVNFSAGAQTPLAGVISAVLMTVVLMGMTSWFYMLPHAVLAATIIVAVTGLIDLDTLKEAWHYDKADALSLLATLLGVVLLGVEEGILVGVVLSLAVLVWRSSHPHMAVVGRVAGTEHFRNTERHAVEQIPGLVALRVDESLFFANATVVEDRIEALVHEQTGVRQVLLICSAVNQVDSTALGVLTQLEQSLSKRGVQLQLAEVKGPVMDRLSQTELGQRLQGRVFLSTHDAFVAASAV